MSVQELISTFSSFVQQFESKFISLAIQEDDMAAQLAQQASTGSHSGDGRLDWETAALRPARPAFRAAGALRAERGAKFFLK